MGIEPNAQRSQAAESTSLDLWGATVQSLFGVGVHHGLRVDDSRTHPCVPQHDPFSAFSPANRSSVTDPSSSKAWSASLSDARDLESHLLVNEKGSRTSDQ